MSLRRFVHPRVEPELAFLLGKPLAGPVSLAEALDAVVGSRRRWRSSTRASRTSVSPSSDVIADNASSSGYVIGPWGDPRQDFSNLGLVLSIDGMPRQIGTTAGILGHPLRSLVAAARLNAGAGEPLQPGWLVMAGGATAAEGLEPGQHVVLEMQRLGRVEFSTIE